MKKLILFLLILLTGCGTKAPAPVQEPSPTPTPARVTLTAVGDNLIHSPIYKQANQRAGGNGYSFYNAYVNMEDYICGDINIINQETPIGGVELGISSYPTFNSPYELGETLIDLGFNVINHANNHFYDAGTDGAENSMAFWESNNIPVIGVNPENVAYIEKNGLKFGIVAYTYGSNLGRGGESEYSLSWMVRETIEEELTQIRENCDIMIVNYHWGTEYTMDYSEEQREYAQLAADCNADLVIGHHPHVIQPVCELTRADGKLMPVAYSLGNFISSQDEPMCMLGGMLTAVFEGVPGNAELTEVGFAPVITHFGKKYSDTKVYLWDNYTREKAETHGLAGFGYDYISELIEETVDNKYLSAGHEFVHR